VKTLARHEQIAAVGRLHHEQAAGFQHAAGLAQDREQDEKRQMLHQVQRRNRGERPVRLPTEEVQGIRLLHRQAALGGRERSSGRHGPRPSPRSRRHRATTGAIRRDRNPGRSGGRPVAGRGVRRAFRDRAGRSSGAKRFPLANRDSGPRTPGKIARTRVWPRRRPRLQRKTTQRCGPRAPAAKRG